MRKAVEEMLETSGMPRAIHIVARYDKELQNITGKAEHPVYMSEGSTFVYLLQNIFIEYPEIEEKYPPGVLAFAINDRMPKPHTPLLDGDIVEFSIFNSCG